MAFLALPKIYLFVTASGLFPFRFIQEAPQQLLPTARPQERCLFKKLRHADPLMQSIAVFFIRVYRVVFTPVKVMFGLQGCCRYMPTCSNYMEEAICTHGICRGLGLGARRVMRCHPWGGEGFDPVPPVCGVSR